MTAENQNNGDEGLNRFFRQKLANYVIHNNKTKERRPIDESLYPHLYELALREHSSRGKTEFLSYVEDSIEKYASNAANMG